MKRQIALRFLIAGCLCAASVWGQTGTHAGASGVAAPHEMANKIASAPVPFITNDGQIPNSDVQFYARLFAGSLFVTTESELVYALPEKTTAGEAAVWAFRESFAGTTVTKPVGESPSTVLVSHYMGDNPAAWKSRLETYDSLNLGEPYPGVRVTLKAAGNNVEKIFRVAPGANPGAIDIRIDGVDGVEIDARSQLVLTTSLGDIVFTAPVAYQDIAGERRPVEVAYVMAENHHYGFRVGEYDGTRDLVIDPLLASTYIGGHNPHPPGNYDDDIIHGMVAAGGDVWVAGATQSPDFPVHLGYDLELDSAWPDGFVTRMSGDLSTVIASTFIGTEYSDRVTDIALDDSGTIIIVGQAGWGFPVTGGAYNWSGTTPTGGGFVARFSADLSTLMASAMVTPGGGYPSTMALGNGGIYFGGSTNSPNFPITDGAYLSTCCPAGPFGIREYDGFAGKLSSDLATLEALTYLGGDAASGIAVAPNGGVFITDGFDYAITGYIAGFDSALTTRGAHLTYYPGSTSGSSRTYFNDVAATGEAVIAVGQTYMNDLPATEGAFDTTCGTDGICDGVGELQVPRSDGFVAIYSHDLQETYALTYFGASDHESIRAVTLGANADIFVTGETTSVDFPTAGVGADTDCGIDGQCDPTGPYSPAADGFVARLSANLSTLQYGSYLGGSGEDYPEVVALDAAGFVYVAGFTDSTDFPTTDQAFDSSFNGGTSDAFVSLIEATPDGGDSRMIFEDSFESGDLTVWGDL